MAIAGIFGEVGSWFQVVIGVGLLIFIHELGHFLVAKWAGVRVLVFSLGFGPEMFGFTRGPTRYRVSWLPLGGYVRMSGETELEEGGYAPDDYPAKPVWKRGLIIGAGVAMNGLLGFLLFATALSVGFRAEPVVVGSLAHGGPAWEAGLRPGDRIVRADGARLVVFPDLVYATMRGKPLVLEVEREGRALEVAVKPRVLSGKSPSIGVAPSFGGRLAVPEGGSAWKAGYRPGDEVVSLRGVPLPISRFGDEVVQAALLPADGPVRVGVLRDGAPVSLEIHPSGTAPRIGIAALRTTVDVVRAGGPAARAGWREGDRPTAVAGAPVRGWISFCRAVGAVSGPGASVRVEREGGAVDLRLPDGAADRLELLADLRFADAESPTAVEVGPGPGGGPGPSPAEAAGIPNGARIETIAGAAVVRFEDVVARIRERKGKPFEVGWSSEAGKGTATVTPVPYPEYGLLALDFATEGPEEAVAVEGAGEVLALSWSRCVVTTRQIVTTISGIFGGTVDRSNIGGPVAIAQMAHRSTKEGVAPFLWLLAVLSINLMFLNVLPIPVLDGGQLALLAWEAVARKPPSPAVVGVAQMAGLVLLLGLVAMVTFGDVARLVKP